MSFYIIILNFILILLIFKKDFNAILLIIDKFFKRVTLILIFFR